MRLSTVLLVSIGIGISLWGCKDTSQGSDTGDILIGEYASTTGSTATFGLSSHEGLLVAVDEINAKGGILGRKVKVITEDDRSEVSEAVTAVQKLISRDRVVAMIGEVASKRSLAGASVCQTEEVPMLSPASTNPDVTRVGDYIFRICFTDDFQGAVCAQVAIKRNWKRVAIFTDVANDYSKGLAKGFREAYPTSAGQVVAEESFKEGDNDFKAQLSRIKSAGVDAVFFPAYYNDVGKCLRQARELGLKIPFFGGDGWDDPQTYLKLGEIANGCIYTDHYSLEDPRPEVKAFVDAYSARYKNADGSPKKPDAMAVLGYDAGRVMMDAIQRAGKAEPKAIRDALATTKAFPGATGTITIDADRNARKPIVVLELRGGQSHLVDTISPQ